MPFISESVGSKPVDAQFVTLTMSRGDKSRGPCPNDTFASRFSEKVLSTSTRFGTHEDLVMKAENLCSAEGIKSIVEAEEKITRGNIDCFIISPCTGNTLAKIANGITDSSVSMAAI